MAHDEHNSGTRYGYNSALRILREFDRKVFDLTDRDDIYNVGEYNLYNIQKDLIHEIYGAIKEDKEETKIGDLKITSIVCDGFDSSLLVKYPDDKVLLNINDAMVLDDIEVDKVDLLTFQYSYANWAGNKGDKKIPSISAASIIAKVSRDKMITKIAKKFKLSP